MEKKVCTKCKEEKYNTKLNNIIKEASSYRKYSEFLLNNPKYKRTIKYYKWGPLIRDKVIEIKTEELILLSLNYPTYNDFIKSNNLIDYFALTKKTRKRVINKLKNKFKERESKENKEGTVIYDFLQKECLKYNDRTEFREKSNKYYILAKKMGIINNICEHYLSVNLNKRMIYSFVFEETKHVYVGLTSTFKKRIFEHHRSENSSVYQYMKNVNVKPKILKLTDFIDCDEAQKMELYYAVKYRNEGYTLLNKQKPGSLGGGMTKWYKDDILKLAENYNSIVNFKNNNRGAYQTAFRLGFLDELGSVIGYSKNRKNYWTFENCIKGVIERYCLSDDKKETFSGGGHKIRNIFKIKKEVQDYFNELDKLIGSKNKKSKYYRYNLIDYLMEIGYDISSDAIFELIRNRSSKNNIVKELRLSDKNAEEIHCVIKNLYSINQM